MAAGGGIGGGGILVPVYILILGFPAKHAIPLSNVTVFGGAVANTILNAKKRHPLADRPLVDWDLILVMEPLTIAGALIGANLNKLLPETIIVVMLVLLLSFTAYNTLKKARKLYAKESLGWEKVETDEVSKEDGVLPTACAQDFANGSLSFHTPEVGPVRYRRAKSEGSAGIKSHLRDIQEYSMIPFRRRRSFPPVLATIHSASHDSRDVSFDDSVKSEIEMHVCKWKAQSRNERLIDPEENDLVRHDMSDHFSCDDFSSNETIDLSNHVPIDLEMEQSIQNQLQEKIEPCAKELPSRMLQQILEEERRTPVKNVGIIFSMFLVVLFVNIMKGGGAFQSPLGIECGSISFWLAEATILSFILVVCFYARSYLVDRTRLKEHVGYESVEGDIRWDERATIVYPSVCCFAGFFAGMFGIGGGIVKGPLMLAMGVHPSVASATSACMILFTSFTATTSFMVFGLLLKDYAIVCVALGFFATLLGQTLMSYLLRKYKRNSYIAFSIGIVVALSALFMTVESVISIVKNGSRGSSGLCSSHLDHE